MVAVGNSPLHSELKGRVISVIHRMKIFRKGIVIAFQASENSTELKCW